MTPQQEKNLRDNLNLAERIKANYFAGTPYQQEPRP
jgi:hypothetical protein